MIFKAPDLLMEDNTGFCPGCGHGIIAHTLYDVLAEMGLDDKSVTVVDVACCSLLMFCTGYDYIGAAHGRPIPTAVGAKLARPDSTVFAYIGDGAAYSIGLSHTMWAAIRNDNISVIVVNNPVFGMTGGQMAPTTLIDQKTTSTPHGRDPKVNGRPFNAIETLKNLDIAYLARGSVDSVANLEKTKKYIKNATEAQLNGEGFSFVEILSPCPTNWNMTPLDSIQRIRDTVMPVYECGEFIGRRGK